MAYPQPLPPTEIVSVNAEQRLMNVLGMTKINGRLVPTESVIEGGPDDADYHDDVDGALDDDWRDAVKAMLNLKALIKHLPGRHDQRDHGHSQGGVAGGPLSAMYQMTPADLKEGKHVKRELVGIKTEEYETKKGDKKTKQVHQFKYVDSGTGKEITDQSLIDRLRKLAPPDVTNVLINPDSDGEVQAIWTDAAGRPHAAYHKQHNIEAASDKFERLKEFHKRINKMRRQVDEDLKSSDPAVADTAAIVYLIETTGFRPGSTGDTKAKVQAYGATTLLNKHVKVDGDKVSFDFIGKKGVRIQKSLRDKQLAALIEARKSSQWSQLLFQNSSGPRVSRYIKEHMGADFKTKDFRTYNGTREALKWIKKRQGPASTEKMFNKWQAEVGDRVAKHLGNTRSVAINSYIDPHVWSSWRKPEWGLFVPKALKVKEGEE